MKNPSLSDLVGGISSVTLGDEEAKRRGVQKSVLERQASRLPLLRAAEGVHRQGWIALPCCKLLAAWGAALAAGGWGWGGGAGA